MIQYLKNLFSPSTPCDHDWVMIDDMGVDEFGGRCSSISSIYSKSRVRIWECSKCKKLSKTKVNYS